MAFALLTAAAASPVPGLAQEAPRVSLQEALRMLARNNLDLRLARARAAEATGLARQAGAFPNPAVGATHEPLSGGGRAYSESYLTLSQRFELPGERDARSEAADRRRAAALSLLRADSVRLAFEAKRAFVEAALAEERLGITERVAGVFREAARSATERYDAGDISLYELRRIHVERARYETLLADAALATGTTQRTLALLLAPEGDAVRLAPEPLTAPAPPPAPTALLDAPAAERRAELAAARAEVEAEEARLRLAHAERLPDVTATGGYKRQSDGLAGAFLGLSLPLPLFDRNAGAVEASDARLLAVRERLALTRRQLDNDVLRAVDAYRTLRQRSELLSGDALQEAGDLLQIARVAYDAGEMELVALLDAAEALHQARTAEARLRTELWIAYYDLERALGGFEAAGPDGPMEDGR
jgi:cobalt-zinc-cadmium efflux system outer membrane protein